MKVQYYEFCRWIIKLSLENIVKFSIYSKIILRFTLACITISLRKNVYDLRVLIIMYYIHIILILCIIIQKQCTLLVISCIGYYSKRSSTYLSICQLTLILPTNFSLKSVYKQKKKYHFFTNFSIKIRNSNSKFTDWL